ncbi:MAG: RNA polymerase sigma-70 factor [Chitinophaga sp.]|uniref:RNA polymerase sigma factor n=1 Tax=Chitinophaga sp. TaxID=1869181 RepID=UPI001B2BA31A|nr:RNA polymerase sigma-70 factor [Chitinophaga sp.]MBO9729648.1 RNA polymerase sigma-70 factor [Chitinophaga sp.]
MSLLKKVAEGDEAAFRVLFDQYWDTVYGVAVALTKSAAMADEMAQDVFIKLWLKREKLAGVENFEGYLFMVARNHIFNAFRKKIKTVAFVDHLLADAADTMPATDTPDKHLLCNELEKQVALAVEHLSQQQRAIYSLSRHHGLSQEEIANTLHISRHTVKSHMNKALHVIRDYLRHYCFLEILLLCVFIPATFGAS